MSDPRDDLAAMIHGGPLPKNPRTVGGIYERDTAYQRADDIIAAGWRAPVPHCDHDWSTDRSTYGGNPCRECNLCGKQEDL